MKFKFIIAMDCECRNAHLRPFRLSICPRTWIKIQLIVMDLTPSSCTGKQKSNFKNIAKP